MSDLNRHVKSDKVKWAITAIAFVLAFVMLIGIAFQVFMPDGKKLTDWFEKQPAQEEELPEENSGAVIDQASDNGVKVMTAKIAPEQYAEYGVSALAENAYTLTATVSGDADAAVTYSAAWKNPSSEWATGKTVSDYVTVSQGSVGSQTATVSVLQAFSEQVIITAFVTDYPEISATCTVDYVATFDITSKTTLADLNSKFSLSITDIVGTLACEISGVVDMTFQLSSEILADLKGKLGSNVIADSFKLTDLDFAQDFNFDGVTSDGFYSTLEIFDMFYENCIEGVSKETYYNTLYEVCSAHCDIMSSLEYSTYDFIPPDPGALQAFLVWVEFDRVYEEKSYGVVSESLMIFSVSDCSDFPTYASGIELDNSSIIAG